jgi:GH15 family glucan-1,4-alpha-glucosidase
MHKDLYSRSIEIILENQSVWGSYMASPAFSTYQYCWLRDGSFIAHAMDTAGEYASATAFFRWVGCTLKKHAGKVDAIRDRLASGKTVGKDDVLHTRFTLDGEEVTVDNTWGNFQIDGYGTWLWALAQHVLMSGDASLLEELAEAIQITLRYLALVWKLPNYDCWEEHPEYLHPYSLSTVYAGVSSVAFLIHQGTMAPGPVDVEELAEQVKNFILDYGINEGQLVKHIQLDNQNAMPRPIPQSGVDSSLIGISVPNGVIPPDDQIMLDTLASIEADLHCPGGGIYRYKADIYYGGGEWLLLTAWLGWYYARIGEFEQAEKLRAWIEAQANEAGEFPEQVSDHLLAADQFAPWVKKWGPVASPLTWSHAAYIILINAIKQGKSL